MNRLLIVDGSNLLFQMFYGMPARIVGRDGRAVQGTVGFVGALLRMIRMISPTHLIVLFDGEKHNERRDLDPEYKANRPDYSQLPEEEVPFSQLPDIFGALRYLGARYYETETCEADDVIAAYKARLGDCEIYISSFDSDLFQLVDERTTVLRYRGENTVFCDTGYVTARYGVPPSMYAEHKSLVGDKSDNIRGVPGVGPKTAAALLGEWGSLDAILQNTDRIANPKLREAILTSRERILTNRRLITLDGTADIPFSLGELAFTYGGIGSTAVLRAVGVL